MMNKHALRGSLSGKVMRNTMYNMAGQVCAILSGLFLTPYIIHRVGVERFGVWAIVGVLTGYFGLLDFGVGTSFVKYISEYHSRREDAKVNKVISTGMMFYMAFSIAILLITYAGIKPLMAFLKIPPHLLGETIFVFWVGMILFCVSASLNSIAAVQIGLQRMDISNRLTAVFSLLTAAGIIFVLNKGWGLRGMILSNAAVFIVSSAANLAIAFRLLPRLRISPALFDRKIFRDLFGFGTKLQISRFANLISFQGDKLLITYFLGVGYVTFYQVGSSVLQQARQLPLLLVSALVPAVSQLDAETDKKSLMTLYETGSKCLIFVSIPLACLIIAEAPTIISVWMGQSYRMSAIVIRILAAGYCAATVSGVASSIAAGMARTELDMKFGVFMAALNLSLSLLLIKTIGFFGVAIGAAVALVSATVYYMNMFHALIRRPVYDFVKLLFKPVLASLPAMFSVILLNRYASYNVDSSGRMAGLALLALGCAIFGGLYVILLGATRYFSKDEKAKLSAHAPLLRYIM